MKHPFYILIFLLSLHCLAKAQSSPGGVKHHHSWSIGDIYKNTKLKGQVNEVIQSFNFHPTLDSDLQSITEDFKGRNISLFLVSSNAVDTDVLMLSSKVSQPMVITDKEIYTRKTLPYSADVEKSKILFYKGRWNEKSNEELSLLFDNSSDNDIAELIVFDRAINESQQQKIESYLAIKYGVSLFEGVDYLSSDGRIIFRNSKSDDFIHRVTAIGRDDGSRLFQKQSFNNKSDIYFVLSLGELTEYNRDNSGILEDHSFIFWSDNDQTLDLLPSELSIYPTIQRSWKFSLDALKEEKIELELRVEIPDQILAVHPENWYVVISETAYGSGERDVFTLERENDKLFSSKILLQKSRGEEQYMQLVNLGPQLETRSTIDLYPNPVKVGESSILTIQSKPEATVEYIIRDGSGRLVQEKKVKMSNRSTEIALRFPHTGIYSVEIIENENRNTKQIIVVD